MSALDGNAIAGQLAEIFGREMTLAVGACAHCGAAAMMGERDVYPRGPGVVIRCRSCGGVVMVLATVRGVTCVDLDGLASLS